MFSKALLLFFILIITYRPVFSQLSKLEIMAQQLEKYKKEDTIKAEMLYNIGQMYVYTNPKKTLAIAKELEILGKKINYSKAIASSFLLEASCYMISFKMDSAILTYNKAKEYGLSTQNVNVIAAANSNIASIYLLRGKSKEAIKMLEDAIAISTKNKQYVPQGQALVMLANAYNSIGDRVKALKTALEALEINTQYGDQNAIATTNYLIGSIYGITGQFKEALQYHKSVATIQLSLNNWSNACSALVAVANDFKQLNKTDSSIFYYNKALKIAKENELIAMQNKIETNLSTYNEIVSKQEEEIEKLLILKKNYEEKGLQQDVGFILCKLAIGYTKVSTNYLNKKGLVKNNADNISIICLNQAMEIANTINNYGLKEEVLRNYSTYYEIKENYAKAFANYQKYILLRDSALNESKQVEIAKLNLEYAFTKKEDSLKLQQANTNNNLLKEQYLNKTQQQNILLQQNELLLNKKTLFNNQQQLSLLNKDKELQHLEYLKSQADLQTEQLLKNENEKQLTIVQKEKLLETAKVKSISQENEFNKLKRRELLTYSMIGLIALLLAVLYIIDRNKNKQAKLKLELAGEKAEIKIKEAEFQKSIADVSLSALRSQMNPHFIFNCLNSIKLYTTQNNNEAAAIYLTKFSKLIRMALENSRSEAVTLQNEIESLELYIQMEAMRFKDKLKYTLLIDKNVDIDFIEIPPMLLQPYVENAIWHGLMHKEDGGNIGIHISNVENENALIITIKDDGVGREKAALLKSKIAVKHKSFGTKVTSERLALINKLYKTEASVITDDIIKNNIVAGTLVTIKIPFA
jgi:tetratricopeptide (TPR) repeat protein